MKHFTKLTALLSSAVLAAAGTAAAFPAAPAQAAASYENIVILGDSISSGYLLGAGESGYYDIIGECAEGTVTNYAVAGHTTTDLLGVIADSSKQTAIKNADLICISIGGNDLMQPAKSVLESKMQAGETLTDAIKRLAKEGKADELIAALTKALRTPKSTAIANYTTIEETIRALNPDTKIVMQTLYNPFEVSQEMLDAQNLSDDNKKNYDSLMNYINGQEKFLNDAMKKLETVSVADVAAAYTGAGWLYTRFTSVDHRGDIHPNAMGHALIAAVIMDTLGDVSGKSVKLTNTLLNTLEKDYQALPAEDLALMLTYLKDMAVMIGDTDKDSDVTAGDAQKVLQWYVSKLAGKTPAVTHYAFIVSDVDHDSELTASDAQYILKYYVSKLAGKTPTWSDLIKK